MTVWAIIYFGIIYLQVTIVELPRHIDEAEIYRRVKPTVPKWVKVDRKLDSASEALYEDGISDADLEAKLAPLKELIPEIAYTRFYLDKNLVRGIIYIAANDKIALQKASKVDCFSVFGTKFGQPYRLEIEYHHTTSIHSDLYAFIKGDVAVIKELAYKKGAMVWDSSERKTNNNNKNASQSTNMKSKFILVKFRSCNPDLIRQLQQNLEKISNCTKFNHEKLHLLFTHTGKLELERMAKTSLIYWNARNNCVFIYGSEKVQEKVKKQLQLAIEIISSIAVLDGPLMVSKKKLNLAGGKGKASDVGKIVRMCQSSGIYHYDFVGNRILASGSEEAFAKLKQTLAKDGLLFEKQPSQLSKMRGRPDCMICFMPPDSDFVRSSVCPHAFCVDCIQGLFDMVPPQFPVKCQGEGCGMLLGIGDIVKTAKKQSLKKILEVAVTKYQEEHPSEVFTCPKQECSQLLSATEKTLGKFRFTLKSFKCSKILIFVFLFVFYVFRGIRW
jgi:hypothetical protein